MATGKQEQFNWAELGGAAAGGAVFAGMGLIAPSFSVTSTGFMANLPKYAGKAGWTALSGAASTGAGMFTSDMLDNGQIDFTAKDYLRAMGTAGMISGGLSFASSVYDYASWDRFDVDEKLDIIRDKFGAENRKFRHDTNLEEYGKTVRYGRYDEITFGPKAFQSKQLALATGRHEISHLTNAWSESWGNRMVRRGFTGERYDWLTEVHAKRVGLRTWGVSPEYWIEKYSMINNNPWNTRFFWPSFGIDQLLSPFF